MSAIPAASVNMRTMADGTLRLTFDIEPKDAQDAFRLFAAPGTPVAIAALQVGYAAAREPDSPKDTIGPLCKWLVMRCIDTEFWAFLNVNSEFQATAQVKKILGVQSRKEVDGSPELERRCNEQIRYPFQKWLVRRQG